MKNWLEGGAVTDLASINKKRRELEEYARIEKIDDQIIYSDIIHYHYQMNKFVKVTVPTIQHSCSFHRWPFRRTLMIRMMLWM